MGTYDFTVLPYRLPTGAVDAVRLQPGSQTYLEVQWAPAWEEGYPGGGRGDLSHSCCFVTIDCRAGRFKEGERGHSALFGPPASAMVGDSRAA